MNVWPVVKRTEDMVPAQVTDLKVAMIIYVVGKNGGLSEQTLRPRLTPKYLIAQGVQPKYDGTYKVETEAEYEEGYRQWLLNRIKKGELLITK